MPWNHGFVTTAGIYTSTTNLMAHARFCQRPTCPQSRFGRSHALRWDRTYKTANGTMGRRDEMPGAHGRQWPAVAGSGRQRCLALFSHCPIRPMPMRPMPLRRNGYENHVQQTAWLANSRSGDIDFRRPGITFILYQFPHRLARHSGANQQSANHLAIQPDGVNNSCDTHHPFC